MPARIPINAWRGAELNACHAPTGAWLRYAETDFVGQGASIKGGICREGGLEGLADAPSVPRLFPKLPARDSPAAYSGPRFLLI
jgi:hypothetical protein